MAEIASAFVSIVPSMRGFGGQLRGGVTASTTSVGKSSGAAFGKVFAAAAALGIGSAVGGFLKGAIEQASDLAETASKVEAIFGKASTQVEKFAAKGAEKLGQTKLEVLNASATFGTFGKAAGLAGGDLSKFSTDFVSLSTDLASFSNTTPEQAVQAIGAALRGEAEPIRQYGVLLDDATLRQEALKLGLIETTTQALTPQQKVLAAQAAIYKQTSDAQGDFERTSGGLANQQRILSASFSDLKTELGTALLPIATQFFTYLNTTALPALTSLGNYLSTNFGPAFERVRQVVQGFFNGSSGDAGAWAANIKSIVRDAVVIATKLWDTFGKDIIRYATNAFRNVQQIIGGGLNVIAGIFKTISAIMRGDWRGAWDGIKQITSGAKDVIVGLIKQLANVVQTVLSAGLKALIGIAKASMEGMANAIRFGVDKAVGFVKSLPGRAASALGDLGSYLYSKGQALIQGLIDGILSKLNAVGDALGSVAGKIKGYLPGSPVKEGPLRSWNDGGAGKRLMDLLADGINANAPKAVSAALEAAQGIRDAFESAAQSVSQAFDADLFSATSASDFIGKGFGAVRDLRGVKTALRTLRGFGLPTDFLARLFASGNTDLILDLASSRSQAVRAADLQAETDRLTAGIGSGVASVQFGKDIQKLGDRLERALEKNARSIADGINGAVSAGQRRRAAA